MPRKWNDDNYTTKKRSRKRCYVFNRAEIINVTISYQSFFDAKMFSCSCFWCDIFVLIFVMWYFVLSFIAKINVDKLAKTCNDNFNTEKTHWYGNARLTGGLFCIMLKPAIQAGLYYRWARRESSSLELANFYNDNFVLSFLRRFWGMCWLLCRSEPQGGDFFDIDDVVSDADE